VYYKDVLKTEKVIQKFEAANTTPLFRPPYGKFKNKQSKKLLERGYRIILWDVLSYDWDKSVSEDTCYDNVVSAVKEGSIVVFHDSIKASQNLKYVLPKVLEYYAEKDYVFKAL
jgi:peptidoglycan/xylan/chitin deacetylase (PgdA/CDA1 family)